MPGWVWRAASVGCIEVVSFCFVCGFIFVVGKNVPVSGVILTEPVSLFCSVLGVFDDIFQARVRVAVIHFDDGFGAGEVQDGCSVAVCYLKGLLVHGGCFFDGGCGQDGRLWAIMGRVGIVGRMGGMDFVFVI